MEDEKYYYLKSKDKKKSLCRIKVNGITRYFACDFPYTPEDKYHSLVKRKRLKDILKDRECLHDYLSGQAEEDWCWFDVYNEKDEKVELE